MKSISPEHIEQILSAGIMAPSGENCQPWMFKIIGNTIKLFNVPERDQSVYNFNQYGSLVAHGAAIENIIIESKHLGYNAQVNLFPDNSDKNLVADIIIQNSDSTDSTLHQAIYKRVTNRKPYKNVLLTDRQRQDIFLNNETSGIEIKFTEDKNAIEKLAFASSINERLVFENRHIHDFFFTHLRFSDQESEKMRNGFYIKTLELKPPQIKAVQLFKTWNILNLFNKVLKVSKKISADNAKVYKDSAVMAIITIPVVNDVNFVNAGRVFQRIWLRATEHNLSMQPLTGVLFFTRGLEAGQVNNFTPEQVLLIKNAYDTIKDTFNVQDKFVSLLFRIGDGGEPSARSPRMLMDKFVKT